METMLIIGLIAVVATLLLRPAPQTQVIYVPLPVEAEHGGLGCAPLIVVAALAGWRSVGAKGHSGFGR